MYSHIDDNSDVWRSGMIQFLVFICLASFAASIFLILFLIFVEVV